MNDIRIYDYEMNLLHTEPDVLSAYWILKYNDIGTFEGTFPLDSDICPVIMMHRYLILIQGDFQALITAYSAKDKKLTVYGKTVNWILSRRTFPAFKTSELTESGLLADLNPGTIAAHVVASAFSDVENFTCRILSDVSSEEHFWRNERHAMSDIVKECLAEHGLGHRVRIDLERKEWIFEVYSGTSLPFIVSEANRNMTEISVTDDAQSFYTSAWYKKELTDKGEWNVSESSAPKLGYGEYYRIVNDGYKESSKNPNGSYLVCIDPDGKETKVVSELPTIEERITGEQVGIYDWETVFSSSTESDAKTELSKKAWVHTVDGKLRNLKYGADYHLGDTFRIQVQKGAYFEETEKTVSDVDIWWENGNCGEKIKFKEET